MRYTKAMKRMSVVFMALMLVFRLSVLAEEPEPAPFPAESMVSQPTSPVTPTPAHPKETQETLAAIPEESATSNATEGESAPSPAQDVNQEELLEQTEEEALPIPSPTFWNISIYTSLTWDLSAEDGLLYVGDEVALVAELNAEAEGLGLQWQVAIKSASELNEDETEWSDIFGAQGTKYTFTVKHGMQKWRWRLQAAATSMEPVYSEEMRLPKIVEQVKEKLLPGEGAQLLPFANIALTAAIPFDEIVYGTEVTLVADIENPREGMLLQWQHMPADAELSGDAWVSIDGATETSYAYVLDEGNESWLWRLLITVPEDVTAENSLEVESTIGEEGASDAAREHAFSQEEAPENTSVAETENLTEE